MGVLPVALTHSPTTQWEMSKEGLGAVIQISKRKSVHSKPQTWKQLGGQLVTVKNQYEKDVIFNNSEIKCVVSRLGIGVGLKRDGEIRPVNNY